MSTPQAVPRDLGQTAFARSNALARLAPAAAFGIVNVLTLDPVTPLLTLVIVVLALPVTGLSSHQLWRTTWPLLVAAATLAIVNTVADPTPGLGADDLVSGGVTAARLLAIALPGVIALATIDAVDLADALVQQLRVPPRFGYGALAALRLMPMLAEDWRAQALASRARGVAPSGLLGRVKSMAFRVLGLLVSSVRRATRLAVALDARGFDGALRATSRPSEWRTSDTWWTVGSFAAAALVVVLSIRWGAWDPLLIP